MYDQSQSCVRWRYKRTEGTEHSPVQGGGCSGKRSLTYAVCWDGRTNTACFNLVVANLYSNRRCQCGRCFFGVAEFSRIGRCVSFSIL